MENEKIYVFDAYGTLFDVDHACKEMAIQLGDNWEKLSSIWRQKQLEYSWLHNSMNEYDSFWKITKDSLEYAMNSLSINSVKIKKELLDLYFKIGAFEEVEEVLKKIKTMVGNSNRQVRQTEIKLSQTELNRIQNHVQKFWKMSYGASEVKAIITLKISTNTDGTVKSVSIFDKTLYQKDKFFRATADAARRAVLDSSPLPLPKGKEKKFQNILMDFNTSFINDY